MNLEFKYISFQITDLGIIEYEKDKTSKPLTEEIILFITNVSSKDGYYPSIIEDMIKNNSPLNENQLENLLISTKYVCEISSYVGNSYYIKNVDILLMI